MKRVLVPALALLLLGAACSKPATTANQNTTAVVVNSGTIVTTNATTNGNANVSEDAPILRTAIVKMRDVGMEPARIEVTAGTVVAFVNESSSPHWIASNPHPSHSDLPEFDPNAAVAPGATFRFTFNKAGTWGYHDHDDPFNAAFQGIVVVH